MPDTNDTEISNEKDNVNGEETPPRAIHHNAPDQAKIDSIKAAKAKLKK